MIAQIVAADHLDRTLSLTSFMATSGKPACRLLRNPKLWRTFLRLLRQGDREMLTSSARSKRSRLLVVHAPPSMKKYCGDGSPGTWNAPTIRPAKRVTRQQRSRAQGRQARHRAPAPRTVRALDLYLDERSSGPIFATGEGRRMDRGAADRIVKRLARRAGIAKQISPHSLRHTFITLALDAGVALRDVQEAASHADRARRCATTGDASHWTGTPRTSSLPSSPAPLAPAETLRCWAISIDRIAGTAGSRALLDPSVAAITGFTVSEGSAGPDAWRSWAFGPGDAAGVEEHPEPVVPRRSGSRGRSASGPALPTQTRRARLYATRVGDPSSRRSADRRGTVRSRQQAPACRGQARNTRQPAARRIGLGVIPSKYRTVIAEAFAVPMRAAGRFRVGPPIAAVAGEPLLPVATSRSSSAGGVADVNTSRDFNQPCRARSTSIASSCQCAWSTGNFSASVRAALRSIGLMSSACDYIGLHGLTRLLRSSRDPPRRQKSQAPPM